MKTQKASAPERFEALQKTGITSFTSQDIQELLGINKKQAMAVIVYGTSQDKIRVTKRVNSSDEDVTRYELSAWRQQWITKPWGNGHVSRDSDRMAPD